MVIASSGLYAQVENHLSNSATTETQFRATNSNSSNGVAIGVQTGTLNATPAFVNQKDDSHLWFGTDDSEKMRITKDGDVGVNTTTPSEKFDVDGNARVRGLGNGTNSGIVSHTSNGTLQSITIPNDATKVLLGDGTFGASPGGGDTDWLKIGGGTPSAIDDDIYTEGEVNIDLDNDDDIFKVTQNSNSGSYNNEIFRFEKDNTSYSYISGQTSTANEIQLNLGNAYVKRDQNGYLWLKSASPSTKGTYFKDQKVYFHDDDFSIYSVSEENVYLRSRGVSNNKPNVILMNESGYDGTNPTTTGNSQDTYIYGSLEIDEGGATSPTNLRKNPLMVGVAGTTYFQVDLNGDVGIGTTSPGGQLELSLDEGRKPTTNTWTIPSDARLKNVNGTYDKGLEEISRLEPIRYNYRNTHDRSFSQEVLDQEAVGFLAQDVQKIFPEAVQTGADGYLDFNMHSILIAQINAIKELKERIEQLEQSESTNQFGVERVENGITSKVKATLDQNVPNPFSVSTTIQFEIQKPYENASIFIYNLEGTQLRGYNLEPGSSQIEVEGGALNAGMYLYALIVDGQHIDTKRMILTK